jgi:GNAT superfamily N-acetyltransferase
MGHPDLVSKGAQKNFAEYARLLDENGEPNVTPEYFHQVIARALFFKGAERIVSKLDLGGYRANIVAYSVAWLAEKSDFRIDLDEIWRKQGLSDDLCKAIEAVARAAHKHFATLAGAGGLWKTNIGENTKKRPCWEQFRSLEIDIPSGWKSKLSTKRFLSFKSDAENLSQLWNEVREGFQHSPLTTKALEISTGKNWPVKMNTTAVASIVANTYDQMIAIKGIGEKTMRLIIEFFAAAKEQN